ncbi:hypothetical protein ASE63_16755 [Bosea sp. Root381]|jgi:hypothetical protein|uniref:hypothetical protein n=1 Tax=Bosea sp. Root381 TaxID=1736524 RepID=UPI0006FE7232|nr:hypothetical protein [Bosea sp. Root381]KRE15868.1 hypothetical protein ASE63_16755 [Bosea sp. Root381]
MDPGILAAIRFLPKYKSVIMEMALQSESFRGLCADFADAEEALRRRKNAEAPEHAAQYAEYRQLVEGLGAELRQAVLEWPVRPNGPDRD